MTSSGGHTPARRTRLSSLVRWVGTLGLGAYIVSRSDLGSSWAVLRSAHATWILLAAVLYALDRLAAAGKWRLLLVVKGYRLPLPKAFSIYLESSFLGAVLPATVGSDLIRARIAQRYTSSFASSLSAVIVERFAGLGALAAAAFCGLVAFAPSEFRRPTLLVALSGGVALVVLWLVSGKMRSLERVEAGERSASSVMGRLRSFTQELLGRLMGYRDHFGTLAVVVAIALWQHYLLATINWILALALGIDVSLLTMLWVWPVVMLAIRIPVSIMGFGVREVLLIELMGRMGIAQSAALTLGVVSGLLDILFVLLGGGLVALSRRPITRDLADPGATDASGG